MRNLYYYIFFFMICFFGYRLPTEGAEEKKLGSQEFKSGPSPMAKSDFPFQLRDLLTSEVENNLLFSPFSIAQLFSIMCPTLDTKTCEGFMKILGIDMLKGIDHINYWRKLEASQIAANGKFPLEVNNFLWQEKTLPMASELAQKLREQFGLQIADLDIRRKPEESRHEINRVIARSTHGYIKEFFGHLTNNVVRVWANTTYFEEKWAIDFHMEPKKRPFFKKNDPRKVRFFRGTSQMSYGEISGCHIVEIPYQSREFSMVWVAPISQSKPCQKIANNQIFQDLLSSLKPRNVELLMPEFKIESPKYKLTETIKKLFKEHGFSLPSNIDQIQHQSIVKVDKDGTVAAAATGAMDMGSASRGPQKVTVVIDHPSQFFLVHDASKEIIFIGNLDDPTPI